MIISLRLVPRYEEEQESFDPIEFSAAFADCGQDIISLICDKLGPEIEEIVIAKLNALKEKNRRVASTAEQHLIDGSMEAFSAMVMPIIAGGIGHMLENFTAVQRDETKRLLAIQDLCDKLLQWHFFVADKPMPQPMNQEEDSGDGSA